MRGLLIAALLLCVGGCLSERGKIACRRAEMVLTAYGQQGDKLAAECGKEMAQVNADTDADKIPDSLVELTPEAAKANASAIQTARETRQEVVAAGKGLLGNAGPWGAGILAALSLAGGLYVQLRKWRAAAETIVEGVGKVANPETKTAVKSLAIDAGIQPFVDVIVQRIDPNKE